jgi:F-type H+-transporting ATPase subunit delta
LVFLVGGFLVSSDLSAFSGVGGRYATALFSLAEESKELDRVAGDLKELAAMLAASADFRHVVSSPILSRADQQKAILAVADKAGFSETTKKFLGTVAHNRRLFALSSMIMAYLARMAERRGEVEVQVASAGPLSAAQQEALASTLKNVTGGKATVEMTVDPSLLGGLVVRIGSRMVDSSLKTKLQNLQLAMKGVG